MKSCTKSADDSTLAHQIMKVDLKCQNDVLVESVIKFYVVHTIVRRTEGKIHFI